MVPSPLTRPTARRPARTLALLCCLCALALAACTRPSTPTDAPPPALLYDPASVARARDLVIATPGALTSAGMFLPLRAWETPGRAVAFYRLPGFDGRPERPGLRFADAAEEIAALARTSGARRVFLVGFSMGNAINLEAARRLRATAPDIEVAVAGISTALPSPQPTLAGLRGAAGTIAAAWRTRSLDRRRVWLDYYRTLLFGRNAPRVAAETAAAAAIIDARAARIFVPTRALARSHTRDLTRWAAPPADSLDGVRLHLFHGTEDPVFPLRAVRRFAATLPGTTLHAYPGDGHLLHLTRAARLFDDIAAALGLDR